MWREACGVHEANDPGFTIKELTAMLNLGRTAVHSRVQRLIKEGKCVGGRGIRRSADGRKYYVTVYELK